jgi:hypothetical protein
LHQTLLCGSLRRYLQRTLRSRETGGLHALHRFGDVVARNNGVAVEHCASFVPGNFHRHALTHASVHEIANCATTKVMQCEPTYLGSYGLPSTSMIVPNPAAAQAFTHSFQICHSGVRPSPSGARPDSRPGPRKSWNLEGGCLQCSVGHQFQNSDHRRHVYQLRIHASAPIPVGERKSCENDVAKDWHQAIVGRIYAGNFLLCAGARTKLCSIDYPSVAPSSESIIPVTRASLT